MAGRPQSAMRTLRLLPPYLLALGLLALPLPVVAQDTSSSSPADQGTDQPEATGPAITSPEAFKIFVEACTSLASGEAGADQRAASAGWTANEASSTGPFSTVYSGYRVPPTYDSLIGKLIVHAPTRHDALMRMKRAIGEMVVNGVETTLPLHMRLVENADIQAGDYDIHWLEHFLADNKITAPPAAASKTAHKPRKA